MIIKTYQKSHLAHLFSPNLSQESANRRLRRWINGDQKLCEELRKVGFFDHQRDHFFTKKEVELLFEYIGEPCNWLNITILIDYDCHLVVLSSCQNQNENRVKTFNKYIYLLILYWRVLTIPKRFWQDDKMTRWQCFVIRLWGYEVVRLWGCEVMRLWGYEVAPRWQRTLKP